MLSATSLPARLIKHTVFGGLTVPMLCVRRIKKFPIMCYIVHKKIEAMQIIHLVESLLKRIMMTRA